MGMGGGEAVIPLSCSFQASREEWTEEEICRFHLNMLRAQYERDAKRWIDRLVQIRQMEIPRYLVLPSEIGAIGVPQSADSGLGVDVEVANG